MKSVYCPKCNSTNVDIVAIDHLSEDRMSMDELGKNDVWAVPAVMRYVRFRASCNSCGYSREYSSGAFQMDLIDILPKMNTIAGLDKDKIYAIEMKMFATPEEMEEVRRVFGLYGAKIVIYPYGMFQIRGDPNED